AGGRSKLSNNRSFVPILPMQSIHASLDCFSAEGSLIASRPFQVLGREVAGAQFTIKDGKVVAFHAEQGEEALAAFFAVDEGARMVSELSLADNDTMESRYLTKSIHPHFAKELTTTVVFGGFSIDVLATQQTDEDVDASNLCRSLVRLEIPVGDSHLSLKVKTSGGDEQIVMYEGIYTETGGV
ncbi:MAG: aminopeptidase, partial [Sphaerochaeta sp.]|nr:aminopeptidase [Sphaerochaeta sp.]